MDRGFATNESRIPEDTFWNEAAYNAIDVEHISDVWRDSLWKIIELCRKKKVQLTFFITPVSESTIVGKGNYDSYVQEVRAIAGQAGIELYDFNLVRPEYFPARDGAYFKDEGHLNTQGARTFSQLFCDALTGKISREQLFFHSLEEKMLYQEPFVYGIAGPSVNEAEGVKYARMIANRDGGIEYRIMAVSEEGNERMIQDFSQNTEFSLPVEEHGILYVDWRMEDGSGDTTALQISY